jgi:hypothetical protein
LHIEGVTGNRGPAVTFNYERLNHMTFQQLVQAVLADAFPGTRAFPVGQGDGGRDAAHNDIVQHDNAGPAATDHTNATQSIGSHGTQPTDELEVGAAARGASVKSTGLMTARLSGAARAAQTIFQVKFATDPSRVSDPVRWLVDAFTSEAKTLERLHTDGKAKKYYLVTNLRGSATLDRGQMDRLDTELATLNRQFPRMDLEVWWRDTLDRHLESAWALWWSYPQILDGTQALALVLHTLDGDQAARRDRALRAFLADQARSSRHLRFKQAELDNVPIDALFVDVPARPAQTGWALDSTAWKQMAASARFVDAQRGSTWTREDIDESAGERAATMLLGHDAVSRIVVIGAPGQGKSTLLQIVCQTLRSRLGVDEHSGELLREFPWGPARLPIEIDLKGYAAFRAAAGSERATSGTRTLEAYLATVVAEASGGSSFDVDDLQEVVTRVPVLLALDALDEIADAAEREVIAEEIEAAGARLSEIATDLSILVTSRPKDAVNNPLLDAGIYLHLILTPLPLSMADDYTSKWLRARSFDATEHKRISENWRDHRTDSHVRDLTTNLMQVSIVLYIFHRRGESVPRNRTALYAEYVRLLFDREADKDSRVAALRSDLEELHGYLALTLHCRAERDHASGSIGGEDLRSAIAAFAQLTGREADLSPLFAGVQRVAALVSRIPGRFEFEVQPLREYFAGTYLYQTAPSAPQWNAPPSGHLSERALMMLERTYWHNTLRFFAGNFTYGEISLLTDILLESVDQLGASVAANARSVALQLLADRVFATHPSHRQRVVMWAFSEQGCRLLESNGRIGSPKLGEETGLLEMIEEVFSATRLTTLDDVSKGDLERLIGVTTSPESALPHAISAIERLPPELQPVGLSVASRGRLLRALNESGLLRLESLAGIAGMSMTERARIYAEGDAPLWFDPSLSLEAIVQSLRHPVGPHSMQGTVFSEAQAVADRLGVGSIDPRRYSRGLQHALEAGRTPKLEQAREAQFSIQRLQLIEKIAGPDAWLGRVLSCHLARADHFADSELGAGELVRLTRLVRSRRHATSFWDDLLTNSTSSDEDLHQAWWCLAVLACSGDTALVNEMHDVSRILDTLTPDRQELVARAVQDMTEIKQFSRVDSGSDRPTWPFAITGPLLLRTRFRSRWSAELANVVVAATAGGAPIPKSHAARSDLATLLWNANSDSLKSKVAVVRGLGVDLDWAPSGGERTFSGAPADVVSAVVDQIIDDPRASPPGLIALAVGSQQGRTREPLLDVAVRRGWRNFVT